MSATDNLGEQWVTMYHASHNRKPPHDRFANNNLEEYTNSHPNVIHMGSLGAAKFFNRRYIHKYEVPAEHIYPVTFGDEDAFLADQDWHDSQGSPSEFGTVMKGKQTGLFETMAGDPQLAIQSKMAVPYRNATPEDLGGISYMVPKSLIHILGAEWTGTIDQNPSEDSEDDEDDY